LVVGREKAGKLVVVSWSLLVEKQKNCWLLVEIKNAELFKSLELLKS
jgi:hypothetical protein